MRERCSSRLIAVLAATAISLTACGAPAAEDSSHTIILADSQQLGGFNPVAGYGLAGEAKIYDGLLRLAGGEGLPEFEPALATALPVPNDDLTRWTVSLRSGVRFHDGSELSADDVVATYLAILNPSSASEIRSSFEMIDTVDAIDDMTVRFTLKYPYAAFPTKLLVGIVPAESVREPGLAAESPLNTKPIGTGPYRLASLSPERAVFEANDDYWAGAPEVTHLRVFYVPDDNTRAQRLAAGEFSGASVPPLLANTFADRAGVSVVAHPSADWRGVSLPSGHAVTGDPAIRRALNHGVDRTAMVAHVLGGYGHAAHTPIPEVYGQAHNPDATFRFDRRLANRILDGAGWRAGPDGVRIRDGERAQFTVMYNAADTVRRDLAQAFASDALAVGIEVDLEALSWDRITPRVERDAILLGGGDEPYDPDTQAYKILHSSYVDPSAGSAFDNASRHTNEVIDRELDRARRSSDPTERAEAYREVQSAYVDDPSYVFLTFLDHTYVVRESSWEVSEPVLEPHTHGVLWGPWWSLHTWTRQSVDE